jgi:hypothetical protein
MISKIILSSVWFLCFWLLISACRKNRDETLNGYFGRYNTDVTYATSIDTGNLPQPLTMDLYYPENASPVKRYPLILLMHGGSYLIGNKEAIIDLCKVLSDSGFIAASINYRVGWREKADCQSDPVEINKAAYRGIQDANAAMRFLVSKSDEYAIDTNWIFIGGLSAGGNIALNSSYSSDQYYKSHYPEIASYLGGLKNTGNSLSDSYKIKGICNMWGAISDSTLITQANAIPAICFHGLKDCLIPADIGHFLGCAVFPICYGSACIQRRLNAFSTPVIIHLLPDAGHDPESEFTQAYMASNIACFFHSIMKNKATSGAYIGVTGSCQE